MNKFLKPKFTFRGDIDLKIGWGVSQFANEDFVEKICDLNPKPDQYMIFKIGDFEFPMMICEHKIHSQGNELEKVTVKSFLLVSEMICYFNLFILICQIGIGNTCSSKKMVSRISNCS